jgi:hypothetical protein
VVQGGTIQFQGDVRLPWIIRREKGSQTRNEKKSRDDNQPEYCQTVPFKISPEDFQLRFHRLEII